MALWDAFISGYDTVKQKQQFVADQSRQKERDDFDRAERKRKAEEDNATRILDIREEGRRQIETHKYGSSESEKGRNFLGGQNDLDRTLQMNLQEILQSNTNLRHGQSMDNNLAMTKINDLTNRFNTTTQAGVAMRGQDFDWKKHKSGTINGFTVPAFATAREAYQHDVANKNMQAMGSLLADGNISDIEAGAYKLMGGLSSVDPRISEQYDLSPLEAQIAALVTDKSKKHSSEDIQRLLRLGQAIARHKGLTPRYFEDNVFIKKVGLTGNGGTIW